MTKDHYEVLGVSRSSSMEQVRTAYDALLEQYHPDKHKGNTLADLAAEKLREIDVAYDWMQENHASSSVAEHSQGAQSAPEEVDLPESSNEGEGKKSSSCSCCLLVLAILVIVGIMLMQFFYQVGLSSMG